MPKYFPAWSYGKFIIVPEKNSPGFWNVKEKGFVFKDYFQVITISGHFRIARFSSIENAKKAIEEEIARREECLRWNRTEAIRYP